MDQHLIWTKFNNAIPYNFAGSVVVYNDEIHLLGSIIDNGSGSATYHYKWYNNNSSTCYVSWLCSK